MQAFGDLPGFGRFFPDAPCGCSRSSLFLGMIGDRRRGPTRRFCLFKRTVRDTPVAGVQLESIPNRLARLKKMGNRRGWRHRSCPQCHIQLRSPRSVRWPAHGCGLGHRSVAGQEGYPMRRRQRGFWLVSPPRRMVCASCALCRQWCAGALGH